MIKKIWNKLFPRSVSPKQSNYIIAQLNDKIEPVGRYEIYEQALDELLNRKCYGEVSGGGTLQTETGEIHSCDLEIRLVDVKIDRIIVEEIINKLEDLGAPKGSKLIIKATNEETAFGKLEGLAVYLDGVGLSDDVYKNSDPEFIISEISRLTGTKSDWIRYWQGNTETGLYFYGQSFNEMKNSIAHFISTNPECENARIERIA
jgi:hypothetical protein